MGEVSKKNWSSDWMVKGRDWPIVVGYYIMKWYKTAQSQSDSDIMEIVSRAIADAKSRVGDLQGVNSYELLLKDKSGNQIRTIPVINEEGAGQSYDAVFNAQNFNIRIIKSIRNYSNSLFHEAVHAMQYIRNQNINKGFGRIEHKITDAKTDTELFSRHYRDQEVELHAYALQAMNWGEEEIKDTIKRNPIFAKLHEDEKINKTKRDLLNFYIKSTLERYLGMVARSEQVQVQVQGRNKRTVPLETTRDDYGSAGAIYKTQRFLPDEVRNKLIEKYRRRIVGYLGDIGKKEFHI